MKTQNKTSKAARKRTTERAHVSPAARASHDVRIVMPNAKDTTQKATIIEPTTHIEIVLGRREPFNRIICITKPFVVTFSPGLSRFDVST